MPLPKYNTTTCMEFNWEGKLKIKKLNTQMENTKIKNKNKGENQPNTQQNIT